MKKVKIGVMGVGRGTSMINFCARAEIAEVVAICDIWEEGLQRQKQDHPELDIAYYTSFDAFIQHDMDAVVLANFATEHAPFAIRAMKAGKHVFSEVLPVQTMQEAVALVEAVEETGMIYAYGENYCYMAAPREMRRLYREGKIGEFEYGEGEYVHNGQPIWHAITQGNPNHWRNNMYATFYCTHSLGPLIHITGLRPVSVIGIETGNSARKFSMGAKSADVGIEMVTLENGGLIKSIHGGLYENSIWYSVYGSKGRMESAREDARQGAVSRIYVKADPYPGAYAREEVATYLPEVSELAASFGHSGSDYYCMEEFVKKVLGDADADTIDVYEALDMFLPGMFAYRSVLNGGIPMAIPNLRDKAVREQYRNDTACTDPKIAGDMLIPSYSKGNPEIDPAVYARMYQMWREELENNTGYIKAQFDQGSGKPDAAKETL